MQWTSDLYDFEADPPPGSWERINFELDNNIAGVRKQLQNFEEEPPAKVWTAVQKELDGETSILIPWYKRPSRWVAAASISGILLLAAYFMNEQENLFIPADIATSVVPAESAAVVPDKKIPTEITIAPPVANSKVETAPATEISQDHKELEGVNVTAYKQSFSSHKYLRPVYASLNLDRKPANVTAPLSIPGNRDYLMMKAVRFNDGNYIQMVSPEGSMTRLSYKLQAMIPALKFNMENSTVDRWKSKLQSTILVPASVNFFDITEMATLLSEQQ